MNINHKRQGKKSKMTADKNFISYEEELLMKRRKQEEIEAEHQRVQEEEERRIAERDEMMNKEENKYLMIIEEINEIPKRKKQMLKDYIKEHKEEINNLEYKYKEKILKHIHSKFC